MEAYDTYGDIARAINGLADFTRLHRTSCDSLFSLRNGFTAYFVLFPENGSFASVIPKKLRFSRT